MKIGMRNVKTAISVFLCVIIFNLLGRESSFYAAIAAIITMQGSVIDSFKTGRYRMLGTTVGAVVGLGCALIQPGNPLLCALGIIVVIYICNIFDWNKSITIGGIVFMAIMVNMGDRNPFVYSFNRIVDTMIGIVITILVNYFIAPPNRIKDITSSCNLLIENTSIFIKERLCFNKDIDLSILKNEISSLQEQIDIYLKEIKLKVYEGAEVHNLIEALEGLKDIYQHFKTIQSLEGATALNEDNVHSLERLFNLNINKTNYENNELNIVFNYHAGKIIENAERIKPLS